MALTPEQQHELIVLLKHAKNACWDRTARKFSAIALTIDNFYETIADNEVCSGLEWEYIEARQKIVEEVDDIFA